MRSLVVLLAVALTGCISADEAAHEFEPADPERESDFNGKRPGRVDFANLTELEDRSLQLMLRYDGGKYKLLPPGSGTTGAYGVTAWPCATTSCPIGHWTWDRGFFGAPAGTQGTVYLDAAVIPGGVVDLTAKIYAGREVIAVVETTQVYADTYVQRLGDPVAIIPFTTQADALGPHRLSLSLHVDGPRALAGFRNVDEWGQGIAIELDGVSLFESA